MPGHWERFQKYMRGGPAAIDGWPDPIPVAVLNEATAASLGAALAGEGFEQTAARRWVRSTVPEIRQIVELQGGKAMSYGPAWGLSLDFVPHVTTAGAVRWHRTSKSAMFDLVYRPLDYEPAESSNRWAVSVMATPDELAFDLQRVTQLTMSQSAALWSRATTVEALPAVYEEQRERKSYGLPFDSFPQQRLAQAFVLARCRRPEARQCLREYVATYEVAAETAQRLEELLQKTGAA